MQDATGKECGLHSGNVAQSAAEQAKDEMRDLYVDGPVEAASKEQLQSLLAGKRDKDTFLVLYAPWCQYSQVSFPDACVLDMTADHVMQVACILQRCKDISLVRVVPSGMQMGLIQNGAHFAKISRTKYLCYGSISDASASKSLSISSAEMYLRTWCQHASFKDRRSSCPQESLSANHWILLLISLL